MKKFFFLSIVSLLIFSCQKENVNTKNIQKLELNNSNITYLKDLAAIHNECLWFLSTLPQLDSTSFEDRYNLIYNYLKLNYQNYTEGLDSIYDNNLMVQYLNLSDFKTAADSLYFENVISTEERDYQIKFHDILNAFANSQLPIDSITLKFDSLSNDILIRREGISDKFVLKMFLCFQIGKNSSEFWLDARDNPNNRWHYIAGNLPSVYPDFGQPNQVAGWPIWFLRIMMDIAAFAKWSADCPNVQCEKEMMFHATNYSSTI